MAAALPLLASCGGGHADAHAGEEAAEESAGHGGEIVISGEEARRAGIAVETVRPGEFHGVSAGSQGYVPDPEVAAPASFSTVFGKAPNFTVLQLSDQSRSCESSVYQYRKYIVKTFFYFFVKERNLPFSADTEFDDIFNYFSALA